jgi:transcriptional regulator GlxA family with amidase domain
MVMATNRRTKQVQIPGMFTCEQAAEKLRMNVDTVRRYVHRGLIKAGVLSGIYLIAEKDLLDFRDNRREPGRPPQKKSA